MAGRQRPDPSGVERYGWTPAWLVFLFTGIVLLVFGLGDLQAGAATFGQAEAPSYEGITGTTWAATKDSPAAIALEYYFRQQAIFLMMVGALTALISATAFRRGELWAWFAMMLWPVTVVAVVGYLAASIQYPTSSTPPPLVSGSIFVVAMLLALALTFRRAFRLVNSNTPPA